MRLLKWIYQNTRPRLWLIGGGSIVEGDNSYMRVDNGDIRDGKASEMGVNFLAAVGRFSPT